MTLEQVNALLDGAKKPFRPVPVCTRLDLQVRYEELDEELRQAERAAVDKDASLDGGTDVAAIVAEMDALRAEMLAATIEFRFEPIPKPQWSEMLLRHPARRDEDGNVVILDQRGFNTDTFFSELVPLSCVWPPLPPERWVKLLDGGGLTDGQIGAMSAACWDVNRSDADVPFSRRHSTASRKFNAASKQPSV